MSCNKYFVSGFWRSFDLFVELASTDGLPLHGLFYDKVIPYAVELTESDNKEGSSLSASSTCLLMKNVLIAKS